MTFVEAPETLADLKQVPKRLSAPQLLNMVLGGKTPIVDKEAATEMGFSLRFIRQRSSSGRGAGHADGVARTAR